ncbi:MAG TPA: nitrite/sulfite reductase [Gaiellaceae bacterium]|jgi:ferredoxin-nitrite reductase|nr:nitrite/sulfite reductase [Gaiellaceae bacterium]
MAQAKEAPTLELVLKRNSVERLKRDKSPLGMLDELPALIAQGYEQVDEEDIVRLKWWGLYHDKPKIGTFMLRVKIPGGVTSPEHLRVIGEISNVHGQGSGELSTRQNVQLHYITLASLPDVFDRMHAVGLTSAGACGDTVRNITGCPLGGLAHDELFDPTPVLDEAAEFFYGNPDYSDLPRKLKIAITACPDACSAPEINCIALIGAIKDGREGFGVLVGGGLSSVPRIAKDLGIWVAKEDAITLLAAILDEWREDLRYRVSRVKSRLKFMIDDIGPEGMRALVEKRLGRTFEDFTLPHLPPANNHLGVHDQSDGRHYVGVPVHLGLVTGDQMIALADLAESLGGDVRLTRQQNFVLTNVAADRLDEVTAKLAEIGLPLDAGTLRGDAVACTGEPHCNFSVTETKGRMDGLVKLLEERFGKDADGLRLNLDGCPHACAHHWVGEIGFQGTTVRDEDGKRRQAYDVYLRGSLDRPAAIGRPVFKRVPTEELDDAVVGLVGGWVAQRSEGESFREFADRTTDEDLGRLAGREAAPARPKKEEVA